MRPFTSVTLGAGQPRYSIRLTAGVSSGMNT